MSYKLLGNYQQPLVYISNLRIKVKELADIARDFLFLYIKTI